ncbi:GILT-like protein 1 [Prorops nasuta]|uniref:GILT-like protein 1 n=1 Tax=Prorops nasuta TaxID=863751 RepID=UPI0034CFD41F
MLYFFINDTRRPSDSIEYIMKSYLIISLAIIYYQAFVAASNKVKKVPLTVDIYYNLESERGKDFFKQQFLRHYNQIKDHTKIKFIPYIKPLGENDTAKRDSKFPCPPGYPDCSEGEFHACAINSINLFIQEANQPLLTGILINCAMASEFTINVLYKCADVVVLSDDLVNGIGFCMTSGLGKKLITDFNNQMEAVNSTIVLNPLVVLNGVYSRENHLKARFRFFNLICDNLPLQNRPSKC